jgi:hypothetical protein
MAWRMAQVVEHPSSKYKPLSWNPSSSKKKFKKIKKESKVRKEVSNAYDDQKKKKIAQNVYGLSRNFTWRQQKEQLFLT